MSDPLVAQRVTDTLRHLYAKVLADQGLTKAEGPWLLGQRVTKEATILSYNDAFSRDFGDCSHRAVLSGDLSRFMKLSGQGALRFAVMS